MAAPAGLTDEQIEFFVANNYVKLEGAIPRELCEEWVAAGCSASGVDLADDSTWGERNVRAPDLSAPMAEVAPELHAAICQLCGGAERVRAADELRLDAGFVVNYDQGADQPWRVPLGDHGGWHVDGDFNHFLDAPEAGLFFIFLWNDIDYQAGPTYIAPDSIPHVLSHLQHNPEGLSAFALRTSHNVKSACKLSVPCMGKAGDCFLTHPQMLHTCASHHRHHHPTAPFSSHNWLTWAAVGCDGCRSSQNIKRQPRFMRNGQVRLAAPMWTADTLSPVERCSLRCLGQDAAAGRPRGFVPPPDELRGACDHDDGGLLPWQYGEKASFSAPIRPP